MAPASRGGTTEADAMDPQVRRSRTRSGSTGVRGPQEEADRATYGQPPSRHAFGCPHRPRPPRRMLRDDRRGSVQVIEAMIVAGLVAGAIFMVSSFDVPVAETEGFKANNERLASDALNALYHQQSSFQGGHTFGSLLEQYVLEALAGDNTNLTKHLDKTMPPGAQYNVFLENGYGAPRQLVYQGEPPREAVAATYPFVPRLAYTFMQPAFGYYHGDFPMSIYTVPVYHGLLARDEGESVEFAVTYTETVGDKETFTMKRYGETALRMNDPAARSWPSISMMINGTTPAFYHDASDAQLFEEVIGGTGYDAYSVDFQIVLDETAGQIVPRGTEIRLEFPRMWYFDDESKQEEMIADETNEKYWEDFTFEGDVYTGTVVTARLKKDLAADDAVEFNVTGDYAGLLDTAYPYFSQLHASLGRGVQGQAWFIIELPSTLSKAGALNRDVWPSVPKPVIGGDTSDWGFAFTNTGHAVTLDRIVVSQPDKVPLFAAVSHEAGSAAGTWTRDSANRIEWNPTGTATVGQGKAAWIHFRVTTEATTDNDYRNADYLRVEQRFSSTNTTDTNDLTPYEYTKRAYRMIPEWSYFERVQPFDDDPYYGWADQNGNTYWVTATSFYQSHQLLGNTTYTVLPNGLTANTFGEYEGSHAKSEVRLTGTTGASRSYELGESVYIKNNFTAMFSKLSTLDALAGIQVGDDVTVRSKVYTPELAWKDRHSATFTETVSSAALQFGALLDMKAADLDGDGTLDPLALDMTGSIHALDGRDGTRFWTYSATKDIVRMEVGDVDGDGQPDLILALEGGEVLSIDTRPNGASQAARVQWTYKLPALLSEPRDVVITHDGRTDRADLFVSAVHPTSNPIVVALDVKGPSKVSHLFTHTIKASAPDYLTSGMPDLEPVSWAGGTGPTHVALSSTNGTVTLLDADDGSATWIAGVEGELRQVAAGDMDGDGHPEILLNTAQRDIVILDGEHGRYGPYSRTSGSLAGWTGSLGTYWPVDAAVLPDGTTIVVDLSPLIIEDRTNLLEPSSVFPNTQVSLAGVDFNTLVGADPDAATKEWMAVQIVDGTAYITGRDGEIRRNTTTVVAGQFIWETVHEPYGTYESAILYDAWLDQDFTQGGKAWSIDDHGVLNQTGGAYDVWTTVGAVCDDAHANAPLECTSEDSLIYKWEVKTDAEGDAEKLYILARVNLTAGTYGAHLLEFDTTTLNWTKHSTWDDKIYAIERTESGRFYALGSGMRILEAPGPAGPWTAHVVHGARSTAPHPLPMDIHMDDAGNGYAINSQNQAFVHIGGGEWQPIKIHLDGASSFAKLMVDNDGTAWAWGDGYTYVPLTTYAPEATATYALDLSGYSGLPDRLEIETLTGHYGSDGSAQPTVTKAVWEYRKTGTTTWLPLGETSDTALNGLSEEQDSRSIKCSATDCAQLELRVTLKNRQNPQFSDPGGELRDHPSVSPTIDQATVRLKKHGAVLKELEVDLSSPVAGSTATWSEQFQALTLPKTERIHSLRDEVADSSRWVGVTSSDIDGIEGGEPYFSSSEGFFAFSGGSGRMIGNVSFGSEPIRVARFDVTGDAVDDIVASFAGGKVRTWDIKNNETETWDQAASSDDLVALVDTSRDATNRSFAVGGTGATVYLARNITTDGNAISTFWSTSTSDAQGKVTFQYEVPKTALFGLHFVVSEMSFEVTEGGGTVTQTARTLDWFEVKPPDRPMPRPPIYEVELVSWFNDL